MIHTKLMLTLDLKEGSILLNEDLLNALNRPRQIQVLINKETRMLLLRACTVEDKWAVVMPVEPVDQFEVSLRSFLHGIRSMMGWTDDRPRVCYGEYLPSHQAIRFDLSVSEALDYMLN